MRKTGAVTNKEKTYADDFHILSTTNPKGVITSVNKCFTDIAGYKSEELIGQPHNIVRHKDMPPQAFAMLWQRIRSGNSWMGIVKNRCKNGDHYWVNAFVTPIQDKLSKQIKEYQSIRAKPEPIWVKRANKVYASLNQGNVPKSIKPSGLSLIHKLSGSLWLSALALLTVKSSFNTQSIWQEILYILPFTLFLQLAISYFLAPLKKLTASAKALSNDPVAMHIYTGRTDDIGQIMLALSHLKTESNALVGRIEEDSNELLGRSKHFMQKVAIGQQKVSNIQEQINEVSTAMEKMSQAISGVTNSASNTANLVNKAKNDADKGSQLVEKTSADIEQLAQNIDLSNQLLIELENNSEQIAGILEVVAQLQNKPTC